MPWACWVLLSFSYSVAQIVTAKVVEIFVLPILQFFCLFLFRIYFESKYSRKMWFLDLNTEGFEFIGFDIPLYASLVGTPFSQSSTLCYEKLYSLTVKKVVIWYTFLLLLDRMFSELFGTKFKPTVFLGNWAGLKLFLIYTLEMLMSAFESRVLTHNSCYWRPLWM